MIILLTVDEASFIFADLGDNTWAALTDYEKEQHVNAANIYMNDVYILVDYLESDGVTIKDYLKDITFELVKEDRIKDIFGRQSNFGPLEESEVRAGPTLSRKRYSTRGMSSWVDPFPKYTSALRIEGIFLRNDPGVATINLVRV